MEETTKRSNKFLWILIPAVIGSVVFSSSLASGFISAIQKKKEEKKAVAEIRKTFTTFIDSAKDKNNMPQQIGKIDTTPKAKGEFGEFERFTKELLSKIALLRNSYLAELASVGWNNLLSMERLEQDPNLEKTKAIVQNGKKVVEKYKSKIFSLLDNAPKDIDKLNMSEEKKLQFASGFRKGLAASNAKVKAVWDLETKVTVEFENLIGILDSKKGSWFIKDKQIVFENDNDLNTFNSCIRKIQELVAKQEAIQKQAVDATKEKLKDI